MPRVRDKADAKVITAAVLSLFVANEVGPRTVTAKDVTVGTDMFGRLVRPGYCSVTVGEAGKGGWSGTVFFDKEGKCVAVAKGLLVEQLP